MEAPRRPRLVDAAPELAPLRAHVSMAVEGGRALAGNWGTKRARRFGVVGRPVDTALLLLQLMPPPGASLLVARSPSSAGRVTTSC